jgi:hypothetical protein
MSEKRKDGIERKATSFRKLKFKGKKNNHAEKWRKYKDNWAILEK